MPFVSESTILTVDLNSPLLKKIAKKIIFDTTVHITRRSARVRISELKLTKQHIPIHIPHETAVTAPYAKSFISSSLHPLRKTVENRLWRSHGIPIANVLSTVESKIP